MTKAVAGDGDATRAIVRRLGPIIRSRVVRTLTRRKGTSGRDAQQEVDDLTQEVFLAIFSDNARILRAWDPERGLSLANFAGLIAEREVSSILRSGRRSPWKETPIEADEFENIEASADLEPYVESKEMMSILLDRVRESLSVRGLELFHHLIVNEEPVESVCRTFSMTPDAVYTWRHRLLKLTKKIAAELSASESNQRSTGSAP